MTMQHPGRTRPWRDGVPAPVSGPTPGPTPGPMPGPTSGPRLAPAQLRLLAERLERCRRERLDQLEAVEQEPFDTVPLPVVRHRQALQALLREIAAAADRLDAGTYGVCSRCRRTIPFTDLEALPYRTRCAHCG